ncbi:hypothetical protein K3495_g1886 [Podosphaera aphanis]|nr:hypothetical protein K3495_g1886 [Podosphaera aphanis]
MLLMSVIPAHLSQNTPTPAVSAALVARLDTLPSTADSESSSVSETYANNLFAGCYALKANKVGKPPRTGTGERTRHSLRKKIELDEQAATTKFPKEVICHLTLDNMEAIHVSDVEMRSSGPAVDQKFLKKPRRTKFLSNDDLSRDLALILHKPASVPRTAVRKCTKLAEISAVKYNAADILLQKCIKVKSK